MINKKNHVIILFMDDVLLIFSNLWEVILDLNNMLMEFEEAAILEVNNAKSKLIFLIVQTEYK